MAVDYELIHFVAIINNYCYLANSDSFFFRGFACSL